jgi:hypothetical protein
MANISTRHRSVILPSSFRLGFMRGLRMSFMQKGRQTFPKAIISRGGLVKQALLRLARQISPQANDGEAKRIFEVVFVVGSHSFHPSGLL